MLHIDTMLRVTAEELQLSNNATSIPLLDGDYAAALEMTHELHCIARPPHSSSISSHN